MAFGGHQIPKVLHSSYAPGNIDWKFSTVQIFEALDDRTYSDSIGVNGISVFRQGGFHISMLVGIVAPSVQAVPCDVTLLVALKAGCNDLSHPERMGVVRGRLVADNEELSSGKLDIADSLRSRWVVQLLV
eukprot:499389-Hanusia_phi.AAC.1